MRRRSTRSTRRVRARDGFSRPPSPCPGSGIPPARRRGRQPAPLLGWIRRSSAFAGGRFGARRRSVLLGMYARGANVEHDDLPSLVTAGLTLDRACAIEDGTGAPPTPEELAELGEFKMRMRPVAAKLARLGKVYASSGARHLSTAERHRFRHWRLVHFAAYRAAQRTRPRPVVRRAPRARRAAVRRARAPAREPDRPPLARRGGRIGVLGGRA